jgi:hypothetical protein
MNKRHYTPHQKEQALLTLQEHDGDTTLVSRLLNIPSRTLYDWRKKHEASHKSQIPQENFVPPPPQIPQIPQLPPLEQSAFGMTRDELIQALQAEYIPSPYNDLRQSLMGHISILQTSISDDLASAHVLALAVSRMLDDVFRLEDLCRREKPPINIIKYEYPDGTYHNIPQWSNIIYGRAQEAYDAVMRQARREYHALKGEPYEESNAIYQPTLEELAQMSFTAEDFIPQHTGILAWWEGRKQQAQTNNPNFSVFNED